MAAAESLGRLGDEAAVPKLIEHLNDFGGADWDQQRVCDVAAAALEAIGTQEAAAAVVQWRRKLNQLLRGQCRSWGSELDEPVSELCPSGPANCHPDRRSAIWIA
ncbi:MAG: hypothetical protein JNL34_06095, partial [Anaerolineae bacterium]|nr:hypothetical protein [Anaerolineae bacterium]